MLKDKPEIKKLAKEFVGLCKKHDIWYTAENGTLLGTIREKGMIEWDDDFDVMMTYQSYLKLKKLFPDRVIDTDYDGYPLLIPKFMVDKTKFLESAVFVDIFIVVPSNKRKVKKYRSLVNKMRFAMQAIHSEFEPFDIPSKVFKVISWPFKWIPNKMTIQEAVEILFAVDDEIETYYTIDNPVDPLNINWQSHISLKREIKKFEGFDIYVPIEWEQRLIIKYGRDYMTPNKSARSIEHVNAISITKVDRTKDDNKKD